MAGLDKSPIIFYTVVSLNTKRGIHIVNTLPFVLTPLFFSKIGIAVVLVALLYHLFQAGRYGRKLARLNQLIFYAMTLTMHKKYVKRTFWIAILAVLTVETVVRLNDPVYDFLFWIHLCLFAVPCFVLLALIRFKYTGADRPDIHWKLIYWGLFPTIIGTLLTGIPLLYRL